MGASARVAVRAFALAAAAMIAHTARAEEVDTSLPSGYVLRLSIPSGWHVETRTSFSMQYLEVFVAPEAEHATLVVTAFKLAAESSVRTADDVRKLVEDEAERDLPWVTQSRLETRRLPLRDGVAFYYYTSDRASTDVSEDFRDGHKGAALLGGHFVAFVIFTHANEGELVPMALEVVRSVQLRESR